MFPCRECLVAPTCTELCKELKNRSRESVSKFLTEYKICPDCGEKNYFNTNSSMLYQLKCKYCNNIFKMYGLNFLERDK